MHKILVIFFVFLCLTNERAYSQKPLFYLNEGLINDNPIILAKRNWMICYPNSAKGGFTIHGDRISIWDINSGSLIKNIELGNNMLDLRQIFANENEDYLIIKYQTRIDVYTLDDVSKILQIDLTIPCNYDTKIINDFIFVAQDTVWEVGPSLLRRTEKYDLKHPESKPKVFFKNVFKYNSQADNIARSEGEFFITSPSAFSPDSIELVDLIKEKVVNKIYKNEIFLNGHIISNWQLGYLLDHGKKVLFSTEHWESGQNATKVLLYDIINKKTMSWIDILLEPRCFQLDMLKKHLIMPPDRYKRNNFINGYKFSVIDLSKDTLIERTAIFEKLDTSLHATWEEYFLNNHYIIKSPYGIHTYNIQHGHVVELKVKNINKVEVIDSNLVYYEAKDDSGIIFKIIFNTINEKNDTISKDGSVNIFTVGNINNGAAYNLIYNSDHGKYLFVNYDDSFHKKDVVILQNSSVKILPSIIAKAHGLIIGELYPQPITQDFFYKSPPLDLSRQTPVKLIFYDFRTGEFVSKSFPEKVKDYLPISSSAYFLYTYGINSWDSSTRVDSFRLINAKQKILAKGDANELSNKSRILLPYIKNMALSKDQKMLLLGSYDFNCLFDVRDSTITLKSKLKSKPYSSEVLGFCNSDRCIFRSFDDSICVYDLQSKAINKFKVPNIGNVLISNQISRFDSKFIVNDEGDRTIKIIDFIDTSKRFVYQWKNKKWIFNSMETGISQFTHAAYSYERTGDFYIYNTETGKVVYNSIKYNIKPGFFYNSTSFIYFEENGLPVMLDYKAAKSYNFSANKSIGEVKEFLFIPDDSIFISTTTNNIYIWNIVRKQMEENIIIGDSLNYLVQNNDGYYKYSKSMAKNIRCFFNKEVSFPQQFDIVYNRPDLFIKDTEMKQFYYDAYIKRLLRNNIKNTKDWLKEVTSRPTSSIIEIDGIQNNIVTESNFLIHASFKSKEHINRFQVFINGIRVLQFSKGNVTELDTSIYVSLTVGENNISISCFNKNGIESNYAAKLVSYRPKKSIVPNNYFIGIASDNYEDSSMNLKYACNDIRDLAYVFKKKYPNCEVDTLINEKNTKHNISLLKQKLAKTNIDDRVIIAFSGHGLLDDSFNFYCATYDVNFRNPTDKGLKYDELQSLLDHIPARKKLLLIDACHSGEIDGVNKQILSVTSTDKRLKGYSPSGARGAQIGNTKTGIYTPNAFELMRELFADITKNNGTVVISASGGMQYAIEDEKYNNGVFTYCIKKATIEGKAGSNGHLSVSELKTYVSQEVDLLTGGKQKPTTRQDNMDWDWELW